MHGLKLQDALVLSKRDSIVNVIEADGTPSRQSLIKVFKRSSSRSLLALSLLMGPGASSAIWVEDIRLTEPENTGWSFQFDNDVFVGGNKDQDYTGGVAVTLSGNRAYASLFFLNSTEQAVFPERALSVKSSFTLGLLGLDFADDLQSGIHKVLGSTHNLKAGIIRFHRAGS